MARRVPKATDIKYTAKDVRKSAARPSLPHGLHYFVHTDAKTEVQDGGKVDGCLKVSLRCAALRDPQDPRSRVRPQMRETLWLPFANPEVPGHKAPDWASGLAYQYLNACFEDEFPDMPRKDEEGNLVFKGEVIAEVGQEDMQEIDKQTREEVMEAVFEKCLEIMDDPSIMLKGAFYGEVGLDRKEGKYTNIVQKYNAIPDDMELFDFSTLDDEEEEEEAPKKKKGAKKKGKK